MNIEEAFAAVLEQSTRIDGILYSPTYETVQALTEVLVSHAVVFGAAFSIGYSIMRFLIVVSVDFIRDWKERRAARAEAAPESQE